MSFLRNLALTSLLILLISFGSGQLIQLDIAAMAQDEEEDSPLAVIFKADDGFDELEDLTESITNLSGSEWIDEFEKQTKFGDFRSTVSDLKGDYFLDALTMAQLFEGTKNFIVYGLFTFPGEYPANSTDEAIELGVVTFLTEDALVIALIDLEKNGELHVFIVFDRVENRTSALPSLNLESFLAVAFLLEALPNLPYSSPSPLPVPGPDDELLCSDELSKVRDLNLTLDKEQSIAKTQDSAGEDLYELRFDTPNLLEIESFSNTHRVDATYNEEGHTRLIILANLGTQRIELKDGVKFRLNVAAEDERHCISGTAEFVDGQFKVTGELHSN